MKKKGRGSKLGRAWLLATWAILSYYYWLDEKVANAILDSYLAKVMGGATYFTVYENHSKFIFFFLVQEFDFSFKNVNLYFCAISITKMPKVAFLLMIWQNYEYPNYLVSFFTCLSLIFKVKWRHLLFKLRDAKTLL